MAALLRSLGQTPWALLQVFLYKAILSLVIEACNISDHSPNAFRN